MIVYNLERLSDAMEAVMYATMTLFGIVGVVAVMKLEGLL